MTDSDNPETITIEVRRDLADEVESILRHEVETTEMISTEQYMAEFADVLGEALEDTDE